MKKLSEYKNEEALDILAELIEPCISIFGDKEIINGLRNRQISSVKLIIKNYKKEILTILATLEGVPVDEYECSIVTLPTTIMGMLNDPDLMAFFNSQGLEMVETSSGSATESTEEEQPEGSSSF